jgi:hypothetical protein
MIRIADFGSETGYVNALKLLAVIVAVIALSAPAHGAADFGLGVGCHTRTGDLTWDAQLGELDAYYDAHRGEFITDLCEHYRVSRSCIMWLLDMVRMSPADVYITIRLHRITLEPVNVIVDTWKSHRGQGWGVITKKLGIEPDSAEFHALKREDRGRFYTRSNGKSIFKDYGQNR